MPHDITPAETRRKIVIVGAGPAGMEAARVAAERGHQVTVFEAANNPGGQIRLTARSKRRAEMIGIIDWRKEQCDSKGVEFHFNCWADADTVLAEKPDVVIIATGGFPAEGALKAGGNLTVSSWDIISGDVKPGQNVLIYDEAGDHAALQAAEVIAQAGGRVEIMTADRTFSPEVMAMNLTPYMRSLQKLDTVFTVTYELKSVEKDGNLLKAIIGSHYGDIRQERSVDQVVVNFGTVPMDDLYFELKPLSSNLGAVDYEALIAGKPQTLDRNAAGSFKLFRIGDAVEARNTHAAIYDGLRFVMAM